MARGRVRIEVDLCKGCGLCTAVCPAEIVYMDTGTLNARGYHPAAVADADRCTGCGNCARFCPDSVMTVELAGG
ncbi:MAG: indolepyruvate ferredoxin oxidoreductase subunit alpha [Spirochaetota bacterium]